MGTMSAAELGVMSTGSPARAHTRTPACLVTHGIRPALPRQDIPRRERFAWRARIRANPAALVVYRTVVGIVGASFIIAAVLVGWLPGPGGTPLFLAGMAVLASEFRWAHILTVQAMWLLRRLRTVPTRTKAIVLVTAALLVALAGWAGLVLVGVPSWLPNWFVVTLGRLPGVPR